MNIFVLDEDTKKAAEYHCDKHVVKMILETAQMLSSAHHMLGEPREDIYKLAHKNHPCSVWARSSSSNYAWLVQLGFDLVEEYEKRYRGFHKTSEVLYRLIEPPKSIEVGPMTPFALAMPDHYKTEDPVESYRSYYIHDKINICTWKTKIPDWFPQN